MKILIIEDDKNIIAALECAFNISWPEVKLISTDWGETGVNLTETENPNLVIVDLGLPDINGLQVIKDIRLFSTVPIIVLTVKTEEMTVVRAFSLGANDYIYKPFRPMELMARIKRLILFSEEKGDSPVRIWGKFLFDIGRRELKHGNVSISLTEIETKILNTLINYSPNIVTYSLLAQAVWGDDYDGAYNCLKVHVRHLRKKIEKDPAKPAVIFTKIGIGYYVVKPL